MYLQITTRCNMSCDHCCYNCTNKGDDMSWETMVDAVAFTRDYTECISIGGGEPTLHPRFFNFLKICLEDFDYVWMATNGSRTDSMFRLSNIIDREDYPECTCEEDDPEEFEEYGCLCHEKMDLDVIYQEDKLSVALSQDCFHDPISKTVVNLWNRRANTHGPSHYEIRDVTRAMSGVIAQGRAKTTGSGWNEDDCVCSDLIIQPDGKIKICGCEDAPIIGDIWSGIGAEWEKILDDDAFRETDCYSSYIKGKNKD